MLRSIWLWIGLGLIGVIAGVWLMVTGSVVAGAVLGIASILLAALPPILLSLRPSERLKDAQAKEALARREAVKRREAEERQREHEREQRRLALLRDIDRIRRAIFAELQKLEPGVALTFQWGRNKETLEWREYAWWPDRAEFYVLMMHNGRHARYVWPAGEIPSPIGTDGRPEWDAHNSENVERAYVLFQPERYLVAANLPHEKLEMPEPGYFRFGVRTAK